MVREESGLLAVDSSRFVRNLVQIAPYENLIDSIGLVARRRAFSQIDAICTVTLISLAAK